VHAHRTVPFALFALACAGTADAGNASGAAARATETPRAASCPETAPAPHPLPGVSAELLTLEYWLAHTEGLDEPLLTPQAIAAHNRALTSDPENGLPIDRGSLRDAPAADRLAREVRERLAFVRERVESGEYVDAQGRRLSAAQTAALAEAPIAPAADLRVALAPIEIRCAPRAEGLFKTPVDPSFDRNNCSTIAAQEPVQILQRWPNGMLLARTRYSLGWIDARAPLSPSVPDAMKTALLEGTPLRAAAGTALRSDDGAALTLAGDALLASGGEGLALFADQRGLHSARADGLTTTARPLTRRAFLEEAFRRVDEAYGWGRFDCSRFVMDVLATFGLELPRHSGRQATSGTYTIDLSQVDGEEERQRLIDAAAQRGIVLLHFPGHIMLYLGRDAAGTPRVIHAFSEYVEPCDPGDAETLRRVDRVTVSDLSLGKNSSRRSFLERVDRVVVFGNRLGPELIGAGAPRRAASVQIPEGREPCEDSLRVRIFHSPQRPNSRQPLRVMITATEELGPAELAMIDPEGNRIAPEVRRLGGPPFTYVAQIDAPAPGRWTVALGDGANVFACDRLGVQNGRPRPDVVDPNAVWTPRMRWEADTEALYSAFVEQLFDYPVEEELTWPNLTVLLQNRANNLLYDHLSQEEEQRIRLEPDCADLPTFLRVYFAWKMRLPFAFRQCTRGRRGELPVCQDLEHAGMAHTYVNEVDAFRWFVQEHVKPAIHSASGRTHPEDSNTVLYPVPLTREALTPGTVFADPYGHLLMLARWIPQSAGEPGVLLGADAQPDGTVGRRRFWRGSFLFHPDTAHVGAGWKAWRPALYDRATREYTVLENERITARAGYVPFSMQQYQGTTDDFYDRMEDIINPRPLDPQEVQLALIRALEESVARRVVSIDNGERWMLERPGRFMEMPEGGAIFQTSGPWEDFATPSRDMRLLISIDTVRDFPDVVARRPERFGVAREDVDEVVAELRAQQRRELNGRTFSYQRSDGRAQQLVLGDVITRAREIEMAYNPNDCMEVRWGAPQDSEEMRACRRHAPAPQRAMMLEYREWFASRRRPIY
jgi:cell wall-associated NlpC family hydrolase